MKDFKEKQYPFIIWTFRRAGGTNLGKALFDLSEYVDVQHEPFNSDRIFGKVVSKYKENSDEVLLRESLTEILKQSPLIKHCLEIMPAGFNEILLSVSSALGYKHLFLYREEPIDRLLSLNFSQKTKIWGKEHRVTRPLNDNVFLEKIPVMQLIEHENICRQRMLSLYHLAIRSDLHPLSLSFESIYKSRNDYAIKLIEDVFLGLNIDLKKTNKKYLLSLINKGGQGTKNEYLRFKNSDIFVDKVSKIKPFKLNSIYQYEVEFIDSTVKFFKIWDIKSSVFFDSFHVVGAILLDSADNQKLLLKSQKETYELQLLLQSEFVNRQFPEHDFSAKSGFLSCALPLSKRVFEVFKYENGKEKKLVVFKLVNKEIPNE